MIEAIARPAFLSKPYLGTVLTLDVIRMLPELSDYAFMVLIEDITQDRVFFVGNLIQAVEKEYNYRYGEQPVYE